MYIPFGLKKVDIWVEQRENTVRDQLEKKTVECSSEQHLLNPTVPLPEAQRFP